MGRSVLDKAARLAVKGRDAELIALLEPQLPLFRDSARYYRLLGSACLRTGDLGGASTYLKRAEQLEPRENGTLLALAALYLRRGETEKAVELYLVVLDERPRDPLARRALSFLRRPDALERLALLIDSGDFSRFCPREPGLPPFVLPLGLALTLALVVFLTAPLVVGLIEHIKEARAPRPEVAAVMLTSTERSSPLTAAGQSRYILTEKEALAAFELAKGYFQDYRDNAALQEINRLLGSNASSALKEKAETLRSFVAYPDWRSVKDVPSFEDVAKDPGLYEGCAVIWKGRAANIRQDAKGSVFDLLVGYHDRKRLEGIVPVMSVDPALLVPPEAAFEILGRIHSDKTGPFVECLALHELGE